MATQQQCYDAWIHYLNNNPEAVEAHLTVHEMAALKASINAQPQFQAIRRVIHSFSTGLKQVIPASTVVSANRRGKHVSDARFNSSSVNAAVHCEECCAGH